jgi:predicted dehydrogenase
MVRVGVIGCGVIHGTHCDALQRIEGAHLAAVYDALPERTSVAAEKFDAIPAQSLEELFANVDAVNICVPSGLHAKIGIEAAKRGKHVLVEKPIDITLAAAQSLVQACREAKVKLATISQHRFARDIRRLREAVQSGALGRILEGDCYNKWYRSQSYYDSGDWRGTWNLDGGGCLMNQGVHYVDMLQWVMGGVEAVQAQTRTAAHERIEVEDIANALLEFKNGATGIIQAGTSYYPGMAERLEIHGLYGTIVVEGDRATVWKVDPEGSQLGKYGDGKDKLPQPSAQLSAMQEAEGHATASGDPTALFGDQHRMQIEDFIRAIEEDRDPEVTGEAALEPLKVILAIYQSAKEGGRRIEIASL